MSGLPVDHLKRQHPAFIIGCARKQEKPKDSEQETRLAKEDGKSTGLCRNVVERLFGWFMEEEIKP